MLSLSFSCTYTFTCSNPIQYSRWRRYRKRSKDKNVICKQYGNFQHFLFHNLFEKEDIFYAWSYCPKITFCFSSSSSSKVFFIKTHHTLSYSLLTGGVTQIPLYLFLRKLSFWTVVFSKLRLVLFVFVTLFWVPACYSGLVNYSNFLKCFFLLLKNCI